MDRFEIQAVGAAALPDVARFLYRWRAAEARHARYRESALSIEQRLRWLLVKNPAAVEGAPLGYCVRDSAGVMRGLTLSFPVAFVRGDERVLGLGSGSFFVEPQARSMG